MLKQSESSTEVYLTGTLLQNFVPYFIDSYKNVYSKSFLSISRNSGIADIVPLITRNTVPFSIGETVSVHGCIQSRNTVNNHLDVYVKAFSISAAVQSSENQVHITGFVCKPVIYRETLMGWKIADISLAINYKYYSSYIPCITWGRNALFMANVPIGSLLSATGRFQSRIYDKVFPSGETLQRTVYEVSLNTLEIIN